MKPNTWTAAECAAAWDVKPATWLGYVSRGQAPSPLPRPDEQGRRCWDSDAVRAFPRPGAGRSRAAATPENAVLEATMTALADELDALRERQRELAREAKACGMEVRTIARTLRVSPQTVYGWLAP